MSHESNYCGFLHSPEQAGLQQCSAQSLSPLAHLQQALPEDVEHHTQLDLSSGQHYCLLLVWHGAKTMCLCHHYQWIAWPARLAGMHKLHHPRLLHLPTQMPEHISSSRMPAQTQKLQYYSQSLCQPHQIEAIPQAWAVVTEKFSHSIKHCI